MLVEGGGSTRSLGAFSGSTAISVWVSVTTGQDYIPGGALSTRPRDGVGDTGLRDEGGRQQRVEVPVEKRKTKVEILRGKMATVLDFTVKRVPFSYNLVHPWA